jgi:hypothetical protein
MWPIIDGHFLGIGVDLHSLPLGRFVSVLENYYVEDQIRHISDPEQQQSEKERLRTEFIKYNRSSNKNYGSVVDDTDNNAPHLLEEPTSDGYFLGLEDGFLGES